MKNLFGDLFRELWRGMLEGVRDYLDGIREVSGEVVVGFLRGILGAVLEINETI